MSLSRSALAVAAVVAVALPATASAQDCKGIYTIEQLAADMVAAENAIRDEQTAELATVGKRMEAGLWCLDTILPGNFAGRVFRAIGAGSQAAGDSTKGTRWMIAAVEADPNWEYGIEDVSDDNPVRAIYATARDAAGGKPEQVRGRVLSDGEHFLDGHKIDRAEAMGGRPHLYQRRYMSTVQSFIVDGAAFPPEALTLPSETNAAGSAVATAAMTDQGLIQMVEFVPDRAPEKTPLIITSAVLVAGGIGLYAASFGSRASFDETLKYDDAVSARRATNALVVTSLTSIGLGAAAFSWSLGLPSGHSDATSVHVHVRF